MYWERLAQDSAGGAGGARAPPRDKQPRWGAAGGLPSVLWPWQWPPSGIRTGCGAVVDSWLGPCSGGGHLCPGAPGRQPWSPEAAGGQGLPVAGTPLPVILEDSPSRSSGIRGGIRRGRLDALVPLSSALAPICPLHSLQSPSTAGCLGGTGVTPTGSTASTPGPALRWAEGGALSPLGPPTSPPHPAPHPPGPVSCTTVQMGSPAARPSGDSQDPSLSLLQAALPCRRDEFWSGERMNPPNPGPRR